MQNLETFFGFRVLLTDRIEPSHIEVLKERAYNLLHLTNYNPQEYHVYFHAFQVVPKDRHFGVLGGIAARCSEIDLTFAVNLKQRRDGKIFFLNYLAPSEKIENVEVSPGSVEISYYIKAAYFTTQLHFTNELITFVARDLRSKFRKIKVSIQATPTEEFRAKLRSERALTPTKLDFRFAKYAILSPPPQDGSSGSSHYKNRLVFVTRPGVMLNIVAGLSLIGQIFNVPSVHGAQKEHKVTINLGEETIEIRYDGHLDEHIACSQLCINEWNEIRHKVLFARVGDLWHQYNSIYGELQRQSTEERLRLESRMSKLKEELCKDIHEMVELYERTLGIALQDHYSLHEVGS